MALIVRLHDGKHVLEDTPLARYLRRVTGDPSIMSFRKGPQLILGSWFNKRSGLVTEHCPVHDDHPDVGVLNVLWQRSPDARYDLLRARDVELGREMDAIDKWQEDEETHYQMVEFLRKRNRHYADHPQWAAIGGGSRKG